MEDALQKNIEKLCQRCVQLHSDNAQLRAQIKWAKQEGQALKEENTQLRERASRAKQALRTLLRSLPELPHDS